MLTLEFQDLQNLKNLKNPKSSMTCLMYLGMNEYGEYKKLYEPTRF